MDVFGHEDVGMNSQPVALGGIFQSVTEEQAILIVCENHLAIIAAQNDVLRDVFDEIARETGHDDADIITLIVSDPIYPPAVLVANAEKARQVLGWSPRYPDLHDIVAHAWAFEQRNTVE